MQSTLRPLLLLLVLAGKDVTASAAMNLRNLQTVTGWNQIGQDINGQAAADQAGYALATNDDGTRLAVTAPRNDAGGADAGNVRVFQFGTTSWTLMGAPLQGTAGANLGTSVAMSGDGRTVAVGSVQLSPYTGFVKVFRWTNNNWNLLGQIDGSAARDRFGGSVSLNEDGTRLAVGADNHGGSGANTGLVEIYEEQNDGSWSMIGSLRGVTAGDRFGNAVSLSSDGTTVAVGANMANPNANLVDAGATYVYRRNTIQEGWVMMGSSLPGLASGDQSGYSVVSLPCRWGMDPCAHLMLVNASSPTKFCSLSPRMETLLQSEVPCTQGKRQMEEWSEFSNTTQPISRGFSLEAICFQKLQPFPQSLVNVSLLIEPLAWIHLFGCFALTGSELFSYLIVEFRKHHGDRRSKSRNIE